MKKNLLPKVTAQLARIQFPKKNKFEHVRDIQRVTSIQYNT